MDVDNYLVQFLDQSSSSRHAAEESDISPGAGAGAGADNVTGHTEARLHRN